jgi:hypothetical protein
MAAGDQAVSTAMRQPVQVIHIGRRDFYAVRYVLLTICEVPALMIAEIEKAAGDVRERDLAGIFVFEPDLTAETTAVAKALPFL